MLPTWLIPTLAGGVSVGAEVMRQKKAKKRYAATMGAVNDMAGAEQQIRDQAAGVEHAGLVAAAQEARKDVGRTLDDRREQLRRELTRENAATSPFAVARNRELDRAGMEAEGRLQSALAEQKGERQQRALFQLPGLAAQRANLLASLKSPGEEGAEALAGAAAGEFGRSMAGEGIQGALSKAGWLGGAATKSGSAFSAGPKAAGGRGGEGAFSMSVGRPGVPKTRRESTLALFGGR